VSKTTKMVEASRADVGNMFVERGERCGERVSPSPLWEGSGRKEKFLEMRILVDSPAHNCDECLLT